MRWVARYLLVGLIVGAFIVLLSGYVYETSEPLRYLGARIG